MKHFGIIGNPLEHSFSCQFFTDMFQREHIDADYVNYSLPSLDHLPRTITDNHLCGFNVTMPYKEAVIPYLDNIDDTAKEIGACNVVKCVWNETKYHLTGYNTDYIGFQKTIEPLISPQKIYRSLLLGSGGAMRAVAYALHRLGIESQVVSRNPQKGITYSALNDKVINEHQLIINCTPLGMYPDNDTCPDIPYHLISRQHIVIDCIYNPEETLFLYKCRQQGAKTSNGKQMLTEQAIAAWHIFQE